MSLLQPSIRITVDAANPGQFFACCGLLELADRLWPGAEGWFEHQDRCFAISTPHPTNEFSELVNKLIEVGLKSELLPTLEHERRELEQKKRRVKKQNNVLSKKEEQRRKELGK